MTQDAEHMPIPAIRVELLAIADEIGGDVGEKLRRLAGATYRRSPARRAPFQSAEASPERMADAVAMVRAQPNMSLQEIAQKFRVNQGRLSEALHGLREVAE